MNFFLFVLFFIQSLVFSQQLTLEKKKLLILPQNKNDEISYQITRIFSGQASKLKRFQIIDRNNLSTILEEQSLGQTGLVFDKDIVEIGNIAGADEGILINVITFGQKGVKPKEELKEEKKDREKVRKSGVVGIIARDIIKSVIEKERIEKEELYPNNIHTTIRVQYDFLNLKNGQSIDSYTSFASFVGGNKSYSLSQALSIISLDTQFKLKSFYSLTSEVLDVNGNDLTMLLGSNLGVKKGSIFTIQTPEKTKKIRDRIITIPSKNVGYARVERISVDANNSKVLRRWAKIKPGMIAIENTKRIYVGSFSFGLSETSPEALFNIKISSNPFGKLNPKISLQGGSLKTKFTTHNEAISYKSTGFFGMGFHLDYNILNLPFGTLTTGLSLPLYITSTIDDNDNDVSSLLTGFFLESSLSFMINPKFDLNINFNVPISDFKNTEWTYLDENNDSNSMDAVWYNQFSPESLVKDFQILLGLRFFIF